MRYKFPHSFRDAEVSAFSLELVEQIKISLLLGCGFVFTLVPVGGLGSLVACAVGWHALVKIRRSGGRLAGSWLALWCFVVGGLTALVEPLYIASVVSR
ncbi:MAG: hypothetical protein ABR563_06925 [Pyrinomonadaceae bacterium]